MASQPVHQNQPQKGLSLSLPFQPSLEVVKVWLYTYCGLYQEDVGHISNSNHMNMCVRVSHAQESLICPLAHHPYVMCISPRLQDFMGYWLPSETGVVEHAMVVCSGISAQLTSCLKDRI
jgi:hypothetical protein